MRAFTSSQSMIVIRLNLYGIKNQAHTHMHTIPPHQAMYVFFPGESSHAFLVMDDRRVERLKQKKSSSFTCLL